MEIVESLQKALKAFKAFFVWRENENHITHSAFIQRIVFYSKAIRVTFNLWRFEAQSGMHISGKKIIRLWLQSILYVNNNWIFVRMGKNVW